MAVTKAADNLFIIYVCVKICESCCSPTIHSRNENFVFAFLRCFIRFTKSA